MSEKTIAFSIIGSIIAIIAVSIFIFYEPPLKSGGIVSIQNTQDAISYDQHQDRKYRNVTKHRLGSDGKSKSYSDRVFDHNEYYIEQHFNGADFIITIAGQSKKKASKIITNTIYVTKDRFSKSYFEVGGSFIFSKNEGDRRNDFNNKTKEMARQNYSEFNLNSWIQNNTSMATYTY